MASRTAADRRPSASGLLSQWSCSAGKLIPTHLRLSGRPAGVSRGGGALGPLPSRAAHARVRRPRKGEEARNPTVGAQCFQLHRGRAAEGEL